MSPDTRNPFPDDAVATIYTEGSVPAALADDPILDVLDITPGASAALSQLLPRPTRNLLDEPARYVHFPWRRALIRIPGPNSYRRLRLDRNRHKITLAEHDCAARLRIGIVGLSVGHAIALTLALEGLAGEFRLADFDSLEVTNLNRVPGSLVDLEINKSVVAARRIVEIDPYVRTYPFTDGITTGNIDEFLAGLDLVIEECDSFDVKVLIRQHCRQLGIPVLMETSDGGTLDIERFDLEPQRPLFHGLAGDLNIDDLVDLDRAALTPLAVRVLEPAKVTAPMAASAIELGHTVTAWPQLGGDVLLGGATVAAAVRRFVQGRPLPSGRVRFDRDAWLDDIADPLALQPPPASAPTTPEPPLTDGMSGRDLVAYAASRAPSAGNQQPWEIIADERSVTILLDPTRTSILDVGHRASAVAVGAAAYNARVAATSRGLQVETQIVGAGDRLGVRIAFDGATNADLPPTVTDLSAVLARGTRRGHGDGSPMPAADAARVAAAADTEHTRAIVLTDRADVEHYASIAARSDRIRFLTPDLHREMFAELTDDPGDQTGIDIESLALPAAMKGMFEVLRRPEVMALLDDWDGGEALGADAAARVTSSSALVIVVQDSNDLAAYTNAGQITEQVWLTAESLGFAVHPVTPAFLYASDDASARGLSDGHGDELAELRRSMLTAWPLRNGEAPTIVLRLSRSTEYPAMSRREPVDRSVAR
ncbi:Rv1355c family protein [Gordonia sp. SL306]|uniref:Rv1355c family protein n=1 Tax=Gordonia sp. SL306 TaxID=2995145 RepID=UPI00226EDB56|nr:Rv1355c family protein [Gordonia sp. SL306]WAC56767.1 Rv1355c family protein [Gordonia sp. SL306]